MQNEKIFFSVAKAAQYLTVSPWTIRSWLRTGRLRGQKAGARVVIAAEELDRFLKPRPVTSRARKDQAESVA
jgi:excisionase family DNA binding protein